MAPLSAPFRPLSLTRAGSLTVPESMLTSGMGKVLVYVGTTIALVAAVMIFLIDPAEDEVAEETVLREATASTGHRLEVYRAELTSEMEIRWPKRETVKRSFLPRALSTSSFTESTDSWSQDGLSFDCSRRNGKLYKAVYREEFPGLLIVARAYTPAGAPISFDVMRGSGEPAWLAKRDARGVLEGSTRGSSETRPTLRLDVSAGEGDFWLPMKGPFVVDAADGRGFFACPIFPRHQPELMLRATFDEGEPITFAVPNPGYRAEPLAWKVDTKPWSKTFDDFAVSMKSYPATFRPGIEPRIDQPSDAWKARIISVADDWGNESTLRDFRRLPSTITRLWKAAALRVKGEVGRSFERYRWPIGETVVLGEFTWNASAGQGGGQRDH